MVCFVPIPLCELLNSENLIFSLTIKGNCEVLK